MGKSLIILGCAIVVVCSTFLNEINAEEKQIVNVPVGGHCALGAAIVNGSWQVVEKNVEKVCPKGSSCRKGACNCDNLEDGTVTGISVDEKGDRSCKRVAGQKCISEDQCFEGVKCSQGACTCPMDDHKFNCVSSQEDISILSK